MQVFETERLALSLLEPGDAEFILELVNDPAWLRYIGDRGVHNLDDACGYIRIGPADMQARLGYSLYKVALKSDGKSIGICGLLKRDSLPDADIGFAFLERYRGQGYAREAASATLAYARSILGLKRILAITSPDNVSSIRLLEKLGFEYQETVQMPGPSRDTKVFTLQTP
ncbi:MAG: GNAT family N-acetyltransferase [Gammaproteobacteria bacterium]